MCIRDRVWTADPVTNQVTWVSPNIERITGWTAAEWTRLSRELVHPEDAEDFAMSAEDFEPDQEYVRSARHRHKDGHWVWLNMVNRAVADGDGTITLYGHCIDATSLVESQARIQRQARNDEVTGLDNRYVLLQQLEERLTGAGAVSYTHLTLPTTPYV